MTTTISRIFPVMVDYDKTFEEMIEAGDYGLIHANITGKKFPVTGKGRVELDMHLVRFSEIISSNEVIEKLKKMGMRPATLLELLAFGSQYSTEQGSIIALASDPYYNCVTMLNSSGDNGRDLNLVFSDRWGWIIRCRFLAVRI